MSSSAVVFAYGDVGIRCIRVLLSQKVRIHLVVTHVDDPSESRWYGSVAELAAEYALPCIAPESPASPELSQRLLQLAPDFIFSFYYRHILPVELLRCARLGAFNMHGSLLPRFRGRAPVNWAILSGARETGATLHHMVARADAGDIVDQAAVPILEDDDALAVFRKVTVAAEMVLARALPRLVAGTAPRIPQRLADGEYCGRRRPEDGRIVWSKPAHQIHDLVRAVAPPFPGAFTDFQGERWLISRTRVVAGSSSPLSSKAWLHARDGQCLVSCVDGHLLRILAADNAHGRANLGALISRLEHSPVALS